MASSKSSKSAEIHDMLGHPVIDVDGHSIDFMPLLEDYIREFTGAKGIEWYRRTNPFYEADPSTRKQQRLARPVWWAYPTANTIDHVTALVPALLEERLGEIGIDFSVIYPSPTRTSVPGLQDGDLRQGMCRALNSYQAELLAPHAAHLTPAAVIPMHNPTEAIEELEYAVNTLGMKATQMASFVQRPLDPSQGGSSGTWWDNLCIDSAYDYDPVWEKCLELKVNPAFHTGTQGFGSRSTPSNGIYNHIGHFAAGQESICKAMLLGGVTHRFPALRVAFLESGVAWAALLLADLVDHFEKRNMAAVKRDYDPANFDFAIAEEYFTRYATPKLAAKADRLSEITDRLIWPGEAAFDDLDEFAAAGIEKPEDIRDRFVPHFFFGCEGEDHTTALAFDEKFLPFGAHLKAVFGSDVGHTMPSIALILEEAYELVEDGHLSEEAFRDLMFRNPVDLLAGTNRDFFRGTAVEAAVAAELQTIDD